MLHGGEIYGQKIEYDFSVNLNPVPCPEQVLRSISDATKKISLYPDIEQTKFREAVALSECDGNKINNIKGFNKKGDNIKASNIIGGNGASELLVAVLRYLNPKTVLMPVPSFYGYRHSLNMISDCRIIEFCLEERNQFVLNEKFIEAITDNIDAVILANPNNPTGRCIDEKLLHAIIKRCVTTGTSLIIDECFLKLSTGVSAKKYIGVMPGLFIISAYTKLFSIPGVRVGYVMADAEDIEGIKHYLPEWNLSVFAEQAGIACANALMDGSYVTDSLELIKNGREQISEGLLSCGIQVFPSDTNFMLIRMDCNLFEQLQKQKILIRDCSNFIGLSEGFYRIAVKDDYSNEVLLKSLDSYIL